MARSNHFAPACYSLIAGLVLMFVVQASVEARVAFDAVQNPAQEEKAAALVSEGAASLERNDAQAARRLFQKALEVDRSNVAAHTYLGVMDDREGRLAEAERHFAAAAIAAPLSPQSRNNHGAILLRMGRLEQAAAQFEISLRLDKNQPSALVNLAQIRFLKGTPEGLQQSRELFERAYAIAPDAEIARSLVIVSLRLKDNQAAARYFRDYTSQLGTGNDPIVEPSSRAELGEALYAAGLFAESVEELSRASQADPQNVKLLLLLARAYLALKQIPAAGRTLEGAVARGLDAAPLYAALAEVYEQSGHVENAIPAMRLAIERDPGNEEYRFRYGMLLTGTQAPAAAVIRLKEALEVFPRSARLWFALGVAHFVEHKSDDATRAFEQSLSMDARFAPALAYLGLLQAEQGRFADAAAFYRRALAIDEKLLAVHYLLADALLKEVSPDYKSIEAHLARAVALDQSFIPARLTLGKLYFRLNRLEDAATQLERAIALQPNLAEAHYQLGRVYTRLKRTPEAQAALERFKQLSDAQKEQAQNEQREIVRRLANVLF